MSYLYVSDQSAVISYSANRFQVKYKDGMLKSIPAEMLEVIEVFGNVQITTQCLRECLQRGINIIYYSTKGAYFGRVISPGHVNVFRQRRQAELGKDEKFCLEFSKKIIDAKIHNQIVVLRRYARNSRENIDRPVAEMKYMQQKVVEMAKSVDQLMGYEGNAARIYFRTLGKLIDPEFAFTGRNRRPPLDPFNSMLSLGYSIILNEIYGKLEGKGLNPYFGMLHQDREKHPTLASDMMEEWRADLTTPSAVFFETQTDVTVGSAAKESAKMYPEQVVTFIKRSIGQSGFSLNLNGIDMKPEEISSYILKKVVKDAEDTLRMEGKLGDDEQIRDVVILKEVESQLAIMRNASGDEAFTIAMKLTELIADSDELNQSLKKFPPDEVPAVSSKRVGDEITLTWKPSPSIGEITYVVVRKENTYPNGPTDGSTVYNGKELAYTDSNAPKNTVLYYSVFAVRIGVHSKATRLDEAVAIVGKVTNLKAISDG